MMQLRKTNVAIIKHEHSTGDSWDSFIHQWEHSNLGHSPHWYKAIQRAYGHAPLYLEMKNNDGQMGILPAFLVKNRWLGTVVSSMPFLDSGGPCSSTPMLSQALVASLVEEAMRCHASMVELRCTVKIDLPVAAQTDKVNLFLPLPSNPDQLWRHLDSKIRNQVRKAERAGLAVEFGHASALGDFYKPFAVNMRDLGSPVHSAKTIGGLVALRFKDSLIIPWASCLREYFTLCPNMLLYWETLRAACMEGFQRFDFGRSTRNSGTYRFKRQWGALEEPLYWYKIPLKRNPQRIMSSADAQGRMLIYLWQHLPLQVTEYFGPIVRKYLTQ
jgi:hypothetical protein